MVDSENSFSCRRRYVVYPFSFRSVRGSIFQRIIERTPFSIYTEIIARSLIRVKTTKISEIAQ